jgi:hypothetical protein
MKSNFLHCRRRGRSLKYCFSIPCGRKEGQREFCDEPGDGVDLFTGVLNVPRKTQVTHCPVCV